MGEKLFRLDVQIAGTAYIKAGSAEAALEKAKTLNDAWIEISPSEQRAGDIEISGRRFSDPGLAEITLSPAMTCHGVWPGAEPENVTEGDD